MNIDKFGIVTVSSEELFEALYTGKIKNLENVFVDSETLQQFNKAVGVNKDDFKMIQEYQHDQNVDINFFDEANQCDWFMPEDYFPNLLEYLDGCCTTKQQKDRVEEEIKLFIQHGMFDLLFYLKYLVDTMREHKIVWGVGRGSSVASYVLFLLGVHKIDSIKYNLDINEFLK